MLLDYGYIGLFIILAVLFTILMPLIPFILGFLHIVPKKPNPVKSSTYECGMETTGKSWVQFNFRYYFYAIIFVVIDVLTIFLYPWAVKFRELGTLSLVAVIVFILIAEPPLPSKCWNQKENGI